MIIEAISDPGSGKLSVVEAGLRAVGEDHRVMSAARTPDWALLDDLKRTEARTVVVTDWEAVDRNAELVYQVKTWMRGQEGRTFWILMTR